MNEPQQEPRRRLLRVILGVALAIPCVPILLLLTAFAAMFLWNSCLPWAPARWAATAIFVIGIVALPATIRPRRRGWMASAGLLLLVFTWFHFLPPSNDRDWQPSVDRVARATIVGDRLTIENVRNFRYRSVDEFEEAWETREYDLAQLEGLEILFSYWGPQDIAHTMMSFGFTGGTQLCLSVEVRKEANEVYSPIASFFKKFELIYIFADERDLVALRTNYRKEDVYMFPSPLGPDRVRRLLIDILDRTNSLADRPQFYGTIRDNCTTSLVGHLNKVRDVPIPFNFDLLKNGHIPEMAWREGNLGDEDTDFDVVKQRYAISARAQAYGDGPEYSRRIRDGLGAEVADPAD